MVVISAGEEEARGEMREDVEVDDEDEHENKEGAEGGDGRRP